MSRITAVFKSDDHAQAALRDLRGLGISDQHLKFSHRSDRAAATQNSNDVIRPDTDGTLTADNSQRTISGGSTERADRDSVFVPPPVGNTLAPAAGLGGVATPVAAPLVAAAMHGDLVADRVNPNLNQGGDPERESRFYDDALRDGHFVVSVDAEDSVQEERVRDVLARHHGEFFTS